VLQDVEVIEGVAEVGFVPVPEGSGRKQKTRGGDHDREDDEDLPLPPRVEVVHVGECNGSSGPRLYSHAVAQSRSHAGE
jgi:hypothetical protein